MVTVGIPLDSARSMKLSVGSVWPRARLTKTNSNCAFRCPFLIASRTAVNMPRDPGPFAVVNQPMRNGRRSVGCVALTTVSRPRPNSTARLNLFAVVGFLVRRR